jgi:ankyrin repeat protein
MTRNWEVDKSKLLAYDYRLFQKTPAWELAKALWDDDVKKINELVQKDKSLINYHEPKFGETLLFLPMWHNQLESFKLLLSLGANPNVYDTYDGSSPIIEACKYDLNIEFVKILLKNRANLNDIEVGERRDNNHTRYTPLMAAAKNGNIHLVKMLVDLGANINYINEFGQSALGQAVLLEKYEIILYLLQNGADFKMPMYRNVVENKPIFIEEALQNMHPGLYSKDYKNKKMIVDFIKVSK